MTNTAEQNQSSTQPATVQPAPVPVKRNFSLVYILIIFILAGTASYFGYQTMQLQQQLVKANPTPAVFATPTPFAQPTATRAIPSNWKTYRYETYEYSFKYPPEFTVEERVPGYLVISAPGEHVAQGGISIDSRINAVDETYEIAKNVITSANTISQTTKIGNWEIFQGTGKDGMLKGVEFRIGIAPYRTGAIRVETLAKSQYANMFDQILSTFVFTKSESTIPTDIRTIFTAINTAFGSTIIPTKENQFYSLQGFVQKESWKLDLSSLLTDKSKFTTLSTVLETYLKQDLASSADGMGQSVQGYQNTKVYCFLLRGFNSSDYISCIEK